MKRASLVACVAIAVGWLGCGDDSPSDGRQHSVFGAREEAARKRQAAEVMAERDRMMAIEKDKRTVELKAQVESLNAIMKDLSAQMDEADRQLAAARTETERAKVQERIGAIHAQQRIAQARIDNLRAGVRLKCPPDNPLC